MMQKTVCELFAGVGGFRLGLEESTKDEVDSHKQWDTVFANQWEPSKKVQHAYDCYCMHFGKSENHVNEDISLVDKSSIPSHNLLVGGFPCQDYSVARSLSGNSGIEGKKGVLWWQIRDTLIAKKAPFVLLENVDRLLKSPAKQRGRDFGIILSCLNELGYNVEWRVINAADYGYMQRRRRTFIFAYKNTTNFYKIQNQYDKQSIIREHGFFASTFPIEEEFKKINIGKLPSHDIAEISDSFSFDFMNAGIMHDGAITTAEIIPIYKDPIPLRELLEKDVDEKYYLGDALDKWTYLKGAKKVPRISKSGHEYTFSEGPVAFPDDINKPARTMLTSESSVNRSTHVVQDPQTGRLRLITPLEADRINGFKDDWTKTPTMPEKFRYFCMGNALVVPLMGKTLNTIFDKE